MLSPNDLAYLTRKREEIINNCPKCHGRTAFCECQYKFQFEYTKIRANIPIPMRDFQMTEITHPRLQTIKSYAGKFVDIYKVGKQALPNLIISGGDERAIFGLATFILTEILRMKRSGYFFPSMFDAKTAAAKNWSPKEKKDIDCVALNTYDVIVLAGFGTGTQNTSAAYEELREVVKTRGANGLLTIFVSRQSFSNLPESEKAIIGACRSTEMACHNWGCSEGDNPVTYYVPTKIGGLTEKEQKEATRIQTIEENEKHIDMPNLDRKSVV